LPPALAAAATTSIRHLRHSSAERDAHRRAVERTRAALEAAGLPVMNSATHILPLYVGSAELCRSASALLLDEHGIYVQPINYPTVPRGAERLRITPTPLHDEALIASLVTALVEVWQRVGLPLHAGVPGEAPRRAVAGNARIAVFPPAGG
jgi:5-aminolevulinate synthase